MAQCGLDIDGPSPQDLAVATPEANGFTDGGPSPTFVGSSIDEFLHAGVEFGGHRLLRPTLVIAEVHGVSHHQAQNADRPEDATRHRACSIVLDGEHDH